MAGTITALVVQKRNRDRVNVFLDGEFAFGLAMIEAVRLRKGQQLSDEEIARLKARDEVESAVERALAYLDYRPRSRDEVRRYLRERELPEAVIEAVIERLEGAGLLDDAAFARFWVENRDQFKPLSERALRYELRRKGVADEIIEAALDDLDEAGAAYRAGQERARRLAGTDRDTFRKRLGSFLSRRGFSYDVARDVTNQLWEEIGQASSTPHPDTDPDTEWED